jgi:hypothetical protein
MGVSRNNGRGARATRALPTTGRPATHHQRPLAPSRTSEEVGLRHGFRSGLEERNAQHLLNLGYKVNFETFKIPYTVPQTKHTYTPDFPLPNGIIVETKGKFEPKDRAKHLFIKFQMPWLDIRFVFMRPNDKIAKGSPTTYAMWCEKNGFKYAARLIPEAWLKENGPEVKPWVGLKKMAEEAA